jgi:hypothetical protein
VHSTDVGSFHTRNSVAETVGSGAGPDLVGAEQAAEVANIAVEGKKVGRMGRGQGCHTHGPDGLVVGGDDKRQDRCSSCWLSIGLFGQTWDALVDESTSPEAAWNGSVTESQHETTSGADQGLLWGPKLKETVLHGVKGLVSSRAGHLQTTMIGPRDDLRSSCASWKRFLHPTNSGTHITNLASQRHTRFLHSTCC